MTCDCCYRGIRAGARVWPWDGEFYCGGCRRGVPGAPFPDAVALEAVGLPFEVLPTGELKDPRLPSSFRFNVTIGKV